VVTAPGATTYGIPSTDAAGTTGHHAAFDATPLPPFRASEARPWQNRTDCG
jgi:hypothetical protein